MAFGKIIRVRKNLLLYSFIISLLSAYFFTPFILIPILFTLVLIFMRKKYGIIILVGLLCGVFLNLTLIFDQQAASTGLNIDLIDKIRVVLTDDSFLSSKGTTIYKGDLIQVSGKGLIECEASGGILLIGRDNALPYYWGEVLELTSSLGPFSDSKEFQFIGNAKGAIERIGWKSPLFSFRRDLKIRVEKQFSFFSDQVSSLFNALFTGNGDFLDKDIKGYFRQSGNSHLLALSGFHVAIIVFLLTFVLRKIIGKSAAILLSFPLLLFYLFFAGLSPSLLRAVIMYFCGGLFILFQKEITTIQILCMTILLQIFISPVQGFSLSFQLS